MVLLDEVDGIIRIKQLGDIKSKVDFAEGKITIQQGSKPDFNLKILPTGKIFSTAYTRIKIPSEEENTSWENTSLSDTSSEGFTTSKETDKEEIFTFMKKLEANNQINTDLCELYMTSYATN